MRGSGGRGGREASLETEPIPEEAELREMMRVWPGLKPEPS